MTATVRAEGEQVVIEQGDARIVLDVARFSAFSAALRGAMYTARDRFDSRRYEERIASDLAVWRRKHPNAVHVHGDVWRDGPIVFDRSNERPPHPNEVNPPMKVKIGGGRVGHLWTGGDYMLCGKYGGRTSVTPCDLPPCPKCAAKAGA